MVARLRSPGPVEICPSLPALAFWARACLATPVMSFTMIAITTRSQVICTETMTVATSATGVMSPNPTVDTTVTVK